MAGDALQPETARALLFGGSEPDTPETTAYRLLSGDISASVASALERLPEVIRDPAVRDIATAVVGLLDLRLSDMLVAGWKKYGELMAAAKASLTPPGSSERVALDRHRVTWFQRPSIRLLVDDVSVATIELELTVEFDVSDLIAVIRGGRLVELQTGSCDVTATLAVQGGEVLQRVAHLDLPGAISLGDGIRLAGDDGALD